ncbi:MAG: alpha-glucoside ABC transporter permease [Phototrophicales bacterium]|nr:MAG: alpha-glucoside ABC transporter permease [Phototrophicales bacterium]RMG75876.1 MAG: carbohydrate ABC transporter permease [Chloroflexota bacterium]
MKSHKTPTTSFEWLGWFLVRATLIFIVVIWTIPTFGLFISSFRDKDQLLVSGWWSSFLPTTRTITNGTLSADAQKEENGEWVIEGNLFPEGNKGKIITYGFSALREPDTPISEPGTTRDGYTIYIQENGDYRMVSPEPFPEDMRAQQVSFKARFSPRWTLENYEEVLNSAGIGDSFLNTAIVAIPSTIIPIAIAAFAAYAFAWMQFPGRLLLLITVVGLLVVPLQLSLIPILKLYNQFSLRGQFPALWLAHTGFGLPFAIYLLYNYISQLPRDIIESAQIDGASHFDIFVRLIVPLSVPALAAFAIFQFLWVWNDFLVALVFLGTTSGEQVLTMNINALNGSRGEEWHIMTSAAFVSMIVPLLVFFSLQRYFVRGLTAGAVKGG